MRKVLDRFYQQSCLVKVCTRELCVDTGQSSVAGQSGPQVPRDQSQTHYHWPAVLHVQSGRGLDRESKPTL